jgi:hypothetical protein
MHAIASDWPSSTASASQTPSPLVRVSARLRAHALDRRLADGIEATCSPVYAARSWRLTREKPRQALARSLERLVEEAEEPARLAFSTVVRPSRVRVQNARPELLMLAAALRSDEPLPPRGIAALRVLLSDGGGPLYRNGDPETLKKQLQTIAAWLDVQW